MLAELVAAITSQDIAWGIIGVCIVAGIIELWLRYREAEDDSNERL